MAMRIGSPQSHYPIKILMRRVMGSKKTNRPFASDRRSARLYVAKQLRLVASDSRLQNRKKPDSDMKKFCNETVRCCKKSDGLCLMKNLQAIEGGKTVL